MAENPIKQIIIKGRLVGIAGLEDIVKKIAASHRGADDEEIKKALLAEAAGKNYIPDAARNEYARALLREFKTAQGLPVAEEPFSGLQIAVLGAGCARCSELEKNVRDILAEMQLPADLRHITEAKEIARYGAMGSPALVINNKVVSVGEVPPNSKIRAWITQALGHSD